MSSSEPFVSHLLQRIENDVDFLVTMNQLTHEDAASIKSKLVSPQNALVKAEPLRAVPPVPARLPSAAIQPIVQVRALWDYSASAADDLSFSKGDVIEMVKEENEHWYRGRLNGCEGLFPSNHVEKLPPADSNAIASPRPQYTHPAPLQSYSYTPPTAQMAATSLTERPSYYQQPSQQMVYDKQPGPPVQYAQPPEPPRKGRFGGGGMSSTLAHSAVGGVGFGAGAAVGSGIINSIF